MRLLAPVALAFALTACNAEAPAPSQPTETPMPAPASANTITSEGWGPLRIGMTRAEVTAAVGAGNPNAVGGPDPEACDLFHPANAPDGMLVMIQHDLLTSITLRNNTELKTDGGFGVGDVANAVKAAYGAEAIIAPHHYLGAPAEYITVWTAGAPANATTFVQNAQARGIRYETNTQNRVTAIHAGGPSIQNVEGCS